MLGTASAADLLFTSACDGKAEIFLLPVGVSEWRGLSQHEAGDNWPVWSADGRWIAFYSDNNKHARLQIIDVRGKRRRSVLAEGKNWYPRWSADGRWLIYTAPAAGGVDGNTDVLAVPVKGKPTPVLLTSGAARDLEASWRPRGN